jgi:hypothetical protein
LLLNPKFLFELAGVPRDAAMEALRIALVISYHKTKKLIREE